ncbi:MAG: DNA polymerase I [Candidatus Eiseniibacteriota bacterium]|nr:MAG: DNA polymerase I [Candidatus Eisenbacteria bacterium]
MKPRVFLIDGSALAYRSFFAFIRRPLINSKGEDTSAAYGVANTLLKLMKEEKPDYVAVVFDSRVPTFRHERFPEYKANREKMPEEMRSQFPRILELVEAMGLRRVEVEGFEADDVMGTLANRFVDQGAEVVLVSGDKDFCQLVRDGIRIMNPRKAGEEPSWVDSEQVEQRFGVGPDKVVDVFALMGDSSDNIPGVPGIGEKTASRLVSKYGGLDDILERLPLKDERRFSEKLARHAEQARLSRELATIRLDVPVPMELEDLRPGGQRNERLKALMEELEFKRLVALVFESEGPEFDWKLVETRDDLKEAKRTLSSCERLGIAVFPARDRSSRPLGIALAPSGGRSWFVMFPRGDADFLPAAEVLDALREVLSDWKMLKCTHDVKSTLHCLSAAGLSLEGPAFDSMLAAYLIDPSVSNDLPSVAKRLLGIEWEDMSSFVGRSRGRVRAEQIPPEKLAEFGCGCAAVVLRLEGVVPGLLAEKGMTSLWEDVELPLARVLFEMERVGVALDVTFLEEMSDTLAVDVAAAETRIIQLAGCSFNLNSPAQLSRVLFEDMGLPPVKKTKEKKAFSTDEEVLEELAVQHEIAREILRYRQLSKLRSTYVDVFPRMLNASTGRLHATFNQTVTATGRLSMSDPNLQNIPARSERGREIRKAFVPGSEGNVLLSADYSQVELRLMAHYSGDERLAEAFRQGVDIHSSTASLLFGVPPEDVPVELRAKAKVVNFGIIYGMSPFGLSRQLGISVSEAKQFIEHYNSVYPGVAGYVARSIQEARRKGYAETLLGRRRPLQGLRSTNSRARAEAERMAINTPIQGSAADMIKVAMVSIWKKLVHSAMKAKLILQVHDELLFELPREETDELSALVRGEMEGAIRLNVPVEVDIGVGRSWFETH